MAVPTAVRGREAATHGGRVPAALAALLAGLVSHLSHLGHLGLLGLLGLLILPTAASSQSGPGDGSLGSGTLLVAGTTLAISPESQTVPFDTPTIVHTTLQGFDPGEGQLPADLRVVGDFTGPEIDGVLEFQTVQEGGASRSAAE